MEKPPKNPKVINLEEWKKKKALAALEPEGNVLNFDALPITRERDQFSLAEAMETARSVRDTFKNVPLDEKKLVRQREYARYYSIDELRDFLRRYAHGYHQYENEFIYGAAETFLERLSPDRKN